LEENEQLSGKNEELKKENEALLKQNSEMAAQLKKLKLAIPLGLAASAVVCIIWAWVGKSPNE
jgi:hypothetical protein